MAIKIAAATCFIVVMVAAGDIGAAQAEPRANHRVALRLSGENCSVYHEAITQKLHQIPGVARVDLQLIEDHILIDRVQDQRTAEDFQDIVNSVIPSEVSCRAETMESCISAGPVSPTPSP